jgi:hypothetical protein
MEIEPSPQTTRRNTEEGKNKRGTIALAVDVW